MLPDAVITCSSDLGRIGLLERENAALLNAALAGKRYVAGNDFSMGDIPLGVFVHRWYSIPMQRADMPNVAAWYERLKARPAFVEHVIKAAG